MFRYLYYRTRFGSYLRNEHGIKKFAEMSMGQLLRKVTKKSAFYREMDENLMVEKANLRLREDELSQKASLNPGAFFSVRRRLWAENALVIFILISAVFLNFIAVTAFVGGEGIGFSVLRWVLAATLAVVLTGGGLVITERLIEALMDERHSRAEEVPVVGRSIAWLWGSLLAGILVAILGIAQVRATTVAAEEGSGLLYFGFIVGSMILPLLAGALRWDALRFVDVYKTTQTLREIEGRLAQIDSILRQNEEYESNFYKIKSISYWDRLNEFKTYKDNYNERKGITENLRDHFSQTYDLFQSEATKRYEADVRDVTAPSMRKLKGAGAQTPAGSKLGQRQNKRPASRAERPPKGDGSRREEEAPAEDGSNDSYMNVQPIR